MTPTNNDGHMMGNDGHKPWQWRPQPWQIQKTMATAMWPS